MHAPPGRCALRVRPAFLLWVPDFVCETRISNRVHRLRAHRLLAGRDELRDGTLGELRTGGDIGETRADSCSGARGLQHARALRHPIVLMVLATSPCPWTFRDG